MKAKNPAARSKSKALDDRYDTETTTCFHCFTLHDIKQPEVVFSHKQKAQLARKIFWAARSEYSKLERTQRFAETDLITWLSATLKQKQNMYIVRTILHMLLKRLCNVCISSALWKKSNQK